MLQIVINDWAANFEDSLKCQEIAGFLKICSLSLKIIQNLLSPGSVWLSDQTDTVINSFISSIQRYFKYFKNKQ